MKVPDDSIPISELGEVVICERRVYLRRKYGARTSAQRDARLERGNMVHKAAFEQRSPEASGTDRRCFIASAVFGPDSAETSHLRAWRDRHLMRSRSRRVLVKTYYSISPMIARYCDRSPAFRGAMKRALLAIIRLTGGGR